MQSCRQNQEKDLRSCGSDVKRTRVAELPCNVVPSSEQAARALALSRERREGSGCGRFASLATGAKASYFQLTSRAGRGLQRIGEATASRSGLPASLGQTHEVCDQESAPVVEFAAGDKASPLARLVI